MVNLKGNDKEQRRFIEELKINTEKVISVTKLKNGEIILLSDGEHTEESLKENLSLLYDGIRQINKELKGLKNKDGVVNNGG